MDQVLADEQMEWNATNEDYDVESILWPLADHQGTVRDIVELQDGTTTTAQRKTYDANGNVLSVSEWDEVTETLVVTTTPAVEHLFGFTARPNQTDTGLINCLNRWYDPVIASWITEDPITFQGGDANLYRYCGNDPVNSVDRSGLDPTGQGRNTQPDGEVPWIWPGGGWNPMNWISNGAAATAKWTFGHSWYGNYGESKAIAEEWKTRNAKLQPNTSKAEFDGLRRSAAEQARHPVPQEWADAMEGMAEANAAWYASGPGYSRLRYGGKFPAASKYGPTPEVRGNAVIGRLDDLKPEKLRAGEHTLLDQLEGNLGSAKANWKRNSSVLRAEMSKGVPIRDASAHLPDEFVLPDGRKVRDTFLGMERNELRNHGWTFDGEFWNPPTE